MTDVGADIVNKAFVGALTGAVSGTISSVVYGQNIEKGLAYGAIGGAVGAAAGWAAGKVKSHLDDTAITACIMPAEDPILGDIKKEAFEGFVAPGNIRNPEALDQLNEFLKSWTLDILDGCMAPGTGWTKLTIALASLAKNRGINNNIFQAYVNARLKINFVGYRAWLRVQDYVYQETGMWWWKKNEWVSVGGDPYYHEIKGYDGWLGDSVGYGRDQQAADALLFGWGDFEQKWANYTK